MKEDLAKFVARIVVWIFVVFPVNFVMVLVVAKLGLFEKAGFGEPSTMQILLIAWIGTFLLRI